MNIIEDIRKNVVSDLFATAAIQNCWPIWLNRAKAIIGPQPTAQSALRIGDHLSEIFQLTNRGGRNQGALTTGGTAWESLITWYINLCTAQSRVVAIKKTSSLPSPVKDAITVNYQNYACSSESDITVIVFPDDPRFTDENIDLYTNRGNINKGALDELVGDTFARFEVGIIQCKTNWNDNAQIPMLWDMIYTAGRFRGRQISVGINNYSIQHLGVFTYAFATVPTNQLGLYKVDSLCVGRVKNLSGGNYWGYPTRNGVARNIKEIFQNYADGYNNGNIRLTLQTALEQLNGDYSYFQL